MTSALAVNPILAHPALVDLYDKVTEDQEAFFAVLSGIFACQTIAMVEYTPRERLYLFHHDLAHHSKRQASACCLTLPAGPFIAHTNQALLFIGNNGAAGVYLALTYDPPEHASYWLNKPQILGMLNHIKQACALALQIQKQSSAMAAIFYAIDHYPIPAFAIDQRKRSVFSNQAAKRLVLELGGHSTGKDLLELAYSSAENRPLKLALSQVFSGEINASHHFKLTINDTELPVIVSATPAITHLVSDYASGKLAWLYILQPELSTTLRRNPRLKRLGLSATEMELAERLFDGISLHEIADERAVSRETVRKQLQSIFRKTNCENQERLMLFLFEQFIQYDLI